MKYVCIPVEIKEAQLKELWTDSDKCRLNKNYFLKGYFEDYDLNFGGCEVINSGGFTCKIS